jgi:hypothetical protein
MDISKQLGLDLGVALNEATLLGVEYDVSKNIVETTFSVLTLPEQGPSPEDSRRVIIFSEIGRIAASLRHARWNDDAALAEVFPVEQLLSVVQSFGGLPIYGWDFFNLGSKKCEHWGNRLSLNIAQPSGSLKNSVYLFQECSPTKMLDICVWFEDLRIYDAQRNDIAVQDFIAGGKRWWDALYAGDPRTEGHGIVPGGTGA